MRNCCFKKVNHIAVICQNYEKSLVFYRDILGLTVISEEWRAERQSMMTKMALNGEYLIELFTFPSTPNRLSHPEACGLRHLAFSVTDLQEVIHFLEEKGIAHEPVRQDAQGVRCFFMADPDGLPIEIVEER